MSQAPNSGMLLLQVVLVWGFASLEYLSQTQGLGRHSPDAWLDEDTEVQHIQAQIFAEVASGREVFEKSFLGVSESEGTCWTLKAEASAYPSNPSTHSARKTS